MLTWDGALSHCRIVIVPSVFFLRLYVSFKHLSIKIRVHIVYEKLNIWSSISWNSCPNFYFMFSFSCFRYYKLLFLSISFYFFLKSENIVSSLNIAFSQVYLNTQKDNEVFPAPEQNLILIGIREIHKRFWQSLKGLCQWDFAKVSWDLESVSAWLIFSFSYLESASLLSTSVI